MAARNVLNSGAVDAFTTALSDLAEHGQVGDWVRSTARRWILRQHDRFFRVVPGPDRASLMLVDPADDEALEARSFEGQAPDWCRKALDSGNEVIFLRLDGTLNRTVRRAIGHLDALVAENPHVSLARMGFPQTVRAAERIRREKGARQTWVRDPGDIPVYHHGSEASVMQLTTPESLRREGDRMEHCVATYDDAVRLGECEVYSVRDKEGASQATIEVDPGGNVLQVKGPGNGPVKPAYRGAVHDFVRSRGYIVLDDFENLAHITAAFDPRDEAFEAFLLSPQGHAYVRSFRYAGGGTRPHVETMAFYRMLSRDFHHLSDGSLRAIFAALSPGSGAPVLLRDDGSHEVYDLFVPAIRVDIPLLLFNLVREGAFEDSELEVQGRRMMRAVENILPTLVFREITRIYLLGGTRVAAVDWRAFEWASTADFLLDCPYDIRVQRANRHRAILERLNDAKHRTIGKAAPPSAAHVAMRRLATGAGGVYAI